jgi:hypothetical protein
MLNTVLEHWLAVCAIIGVTGVIVIEIIKVVQRRGRS